MKRIKILEWTLPVGMMVMLLVTGLIAQSCSEPEQIISKGVKDQQFYSQFTACGAILLVGTLLSIFNFIQIRKISRKLKEIGYSI